jgi:hypothetical protein
MKLLKVGKILLFLSTLILVGYFSPASISSAQQTQPTHCDPWSPTFCDFRRFPTNVVPYYISYSHLPENGGVEKLGQGAYLGQRERDGIAEALKLWSDASGLVFVEQTDPLPPNTGITFGWTYLPEFILGRVFAQWPGEGNTNGARVVFNRNLDWTQFYTDNFNANVDFISVAAHEIGHAIGMTHTGNPAAMMYRAGFESKRELHPEDKERALILYPRGGGTSTADTGNGNCVIPASGPWPPCATNGGTTAPAPSNNGGGNCVIPASGPWPPCARNGGGTTAPPTPSNNGGGNCVIPPSGPWPPCAR